MDLDARTETATSSQQSAAYKVPLRDDPVTLRRIEDDTAETLPTSDESFISANVFAWPCDSV